MPGRGRKVAEGIYLQTSGRYYATVSYDDPETTKRRTISGTFDTLDQAKDWRLVNKVKRQRKQLHPGERTVATLLAAYADYMIEGEHWSRGGTVTSNETAASASKSMPLSVAVAVFHVAVSSTGTAT